MSAVHTQKERPSEPELISLVEKRKTKLLRVASERNKIESKIDEQEGVGPLTRRW